jgi:hypothetical protein
VCGTEGWILLLADEIGGGNGLATFPTSIHYDRPTVDGDMMVSGAETSYGKLLMKAGKGVSINGAW